MLTWLNRHCPYEAHGRTVQYHILSYIYIHARDWLAIILGPLVSE